MRAPTTTADRLTSGFWTYPFLKNKSKTSFEEDNLTKKNGMKRPLDCMKDWRKYDTAPQISEKSKPSFSLSEAFHALAAWRQTSPRVLLGANPPEKSFFLSIVWKTCCERFWLWLSDGEWGLSVWGPHSWLRKYDVVSRCIWGCTSPPPLLSEVYSSHVVRLRALLCCPGDRIVSAAASLISLWTLPRSSFSHADTQCCHWECTLSISRRPSEQHVPPHQPSPPDPFPHCLQRL